MAWIDDRFWVHPKADGLTDKAFRLAITAILYSHGFGLYGRLTPSHQKTIGTTPKTRGELLHAGLWEQDGNDILIHDWDDHNGKRDTALEQRRAADRERKRRQREHKMSRDSHVTGSVTSADRHVTVPRAGAGAGAHARAGARLVTSDRVTRTPTEPSVSTQDQRNGRTHDNDATIHPVSQTLGQLMQAAQHAQTRRGAAA